ncbi:anti-sigma factor family protein [Streptomyces sp. NPDC003697]
MTSTADAAGHPDVEEISDLTEGLLSAPRAADVTRHLDGCELCADVHASLEEIRAALGSMPDAPRMPADVAGRIDAALAAQALLNATEPEPGSTPALAGASWDESDPGEGPEDTEAAPGTGGAAQRGAAREADGSRVSRETSSTRRAGHTRPADTGPGRKGRPWRGRRRIAVLGSALTVVVLGMVSVVLASVQGDGEDSGTSAHRRPSATVDAFSEDTLGTQVGDLLGQAGRSPGASRTPHTFGAGSAPGTDGPNVLKDRPAVSLPPCVRIGLGRDDDALAARKGVYSGRDAYLVVLPDASGDATRVAAYVVDASCVQHPSAPVGILLSRSYPRS